jgi:hypothetical protein
MFTYLWNLLSTVTNACLDHLGKEYVSRENVSRENVSRENVSRENVSREYVSGENASGDTINKTNAVKRSADVIYTPEVLADLRKKRTERRAVRKRRLDAEKKAKEEEKNRKEEENATLTDEEKVKKDIGEDKEKDRKELEEMYKYVTEECEEMFRNDRYKPLYVENKEKDKGDKEEYKETEIPNNCVYVMEGTTRVNKFIAPDDGYNIEPDGKINFGFNLCPTEYQPSGYRPSPYMEDAYIVLEKKTQDIEKKLREIVDKY